MSILSGFDTNDDIVQVSGGGLTTADFRLVAFWASIWNGAVMAGAKPSRCLESSIRSTPSVLVIVGRAKDLRLVMGGGEAGGISSIGLANTS